MKYLKLFDGLNTPIIHEFDKHPFDSLYSDDIITHFIEDIDDGSWEIKVRDNDDLTLTQKMGHLLTIVRNVRTINLFNRDNINPNADFLFAEIKINHPKYRVKSVMFDFDNYIRQTMINKVKRFYNHYDVNIFMGVINIDWMSDPMFKLFLIIQDNKHDPLYKQTLSVGCRVHESSSEDIEVIKDYFMELDSHKDDNNLPIKVEVEDHVVNKSINDAFGKKYVPTHLRGRNYKKKTQKVKGFKVLIYFDIQDQRYVKSVVDTAIKRMKRDYKIHYNFISKSGNGYNRKQIPIHGTDRTSCVFDPIWKQIITLTQIPANESFIEDIDDVVEITLENDDMFVSLHNVSFDLLRKEICGEGNYYSKYGMNKLRCYYGSLTNADFIPKYNTIVEAKQIFIDIKQEISNEFIKEKFGKLIRLYPDVMIFGRYIVTHHRENEHESSNRYELILVNTNDHIK